VLNSSNQNILFSKKQTHCSYVWRHTYVQSTSAWGPRCDSLITVAEISHTWAKHVKQNAPEWLQLLYSLRITIRVFVDFLDCKASNATKPLLERMWGLNYPYAVIIKIRIKKYKVTIIESSKAEQNAVNSKHLKRFCPSLLHNKII